VKYLTKCPPSLLSYSLNSATHPIQYPHWFCSQNSWLSKIWSC